MTQIRLAKKGEEIDQKNMWKVCFGDEDSYIDLYYSEKHKADETAVLLEDNKIAAMATMIPARVIIPSGKALELSMLYAVATHPDHQGKGYSAQIMAFCHKHLMETGMDLSILVPAEESLFDFYAKRSYEKAFYIRETVLSRAQVLSFKTTIKQEISIEKIGAADYNKRRRDLLAGRLYIDYNNEEIAYQKKVSIKFGADLYGINIGQYRGCAMVEWFNHSKVFIKEILMPAHLLKEGLKEITELLPADSYMIRLPTFLGEDLGGIIKPFGMANLYHHIPKEIKDKILDDKHGYLGMAYD